MTGTIKFLKNGYGFIGVEGQKDIFFHAKDLEYVEFDNLKTGMAVDFEIGDSPKGPKAVNVKIA